ncbi:MAG: hypothetical protein ACOX6W_06010 [Lentisphaeria bacterium]
MDFSAGRTAPRLRPVPDAPHLASVQCRTHRTSPPSSAGRTAPRLRPVPDAPHLASVQCRTHRTSPPSSAGTLVPDAPPLAPFLRPLLVGNPRINQ